jgi:excisionase family DNA binding protein
MNPSANEHLPVTPQVVVGPSKAMTMLDCGRTYLYELLAAGELESYRDGKSRKITVASIYARIRRKLQENKAA